MKKTEVRMGLAQQVLNSPKYFTCKNISSNVVRLGNKLFFYSFAIGLAEKYQRKLLVPDYYLWKYLKNPPEISDIVGSLEFTLPTDDYDSNFVKQFFYNHNDDIIDITGNCQSELTFDNCKDKVYQLLEFNESYVEKIKAKYNIFFTKPTIGIGIRLGRDMLANPCFYKISSDWYIETLNKFFYDWKENYNVVIFSDNIRLAQEIYKDYNFFYADNNNTYLFRPGFDNSEEGIDHLILGHLMDNFIISQSTFSWWQGWLCQNNPKNENAKIIHSGKNFDGFCLQTLKNKSYYPKSWIENKVN